MGHIFRLTALTIAATAFAGIAFAQNFPTKPIRFIVGPGPDVFARVIGQRLTDAWGQQVVVDQRPAAGGIIAADTVAKSLPDGYTMLLTTGVYTIQTVIFPKLPYNLERDLAPVGLLATIPFVLAVNPSMPAKSLQDFIQLAKAKPGALNCAHAGPGTTSHFGCELLKSGAGVDIMSVAYKGWMPAIVDVVSGQAHLTFIAMVAGLPQVQAGKLRALAVTGEKRFAALPDAPTVTESGVPAVDFYSWNGVNVRAGTPPEIIAKLNSEFGRALQAPEIRERMRGLGLEPAGGTPEAYGAFIKADLARWAKLIKESGLRFE